MRSLLDETGFALIPMPQSADVPNGGRQALLSTKIKRMSLIMALTGGCLWTMTSSTEAFSGYNVVTTTDPVLESQFLSDTTSYFQANWKVNPLVSNTYQINLVGLGQPPDLQGGPLNDCISQGFADGMDAERWATIQIMKKIQNNDQNNGTCAGIIVDTTSAVNCQLIYNNIGSIIAQRWLEVYSSTGGVVAP